MRSGYKVRAKTFPCHMTHANRRHMHAANARHIQLTALSSELSEEQRRYIRVYVSL